ncbi:c-type cytochrome [Sulfurovum sp. TSL1]|uniref:c-type cytochrome n=1 Tax=Sulfurovum sp. TSL1 TaxID=2826994 RepID=UPI001CC3410C|nr:c-type cytochrome [Sulfurovum sp. TSL1]GIT97800.1 cytochrome c-553 [Sulfurovum sp. TSL1]
MLRKTGLLLFTASFLSASPIQTIYVQKCASCHGTSGDIKTMGRSKAINGMSVESIEKAMIEIASGERKSIGFVKSTKEAFIKKHSKEELDELAAYIHSLQ